MTARARIALICVLLGCNRSSGPPDANYEQASRTYQQLYTQKLDDAYGEPQMDEVVSLLHRVDGHSVDAPAAQALLAAIEDGRKRFQAARAEREKTASAPVQTGTSSSIDPSAVLAAGKDKDAGPPQDPYGAGASIADMNAASGGCLVASEPFHENGTNVQGTIYRMSSSPACADKLAGFVGQAALVVDGKLYRRVSESEVPKPAPPPPPAPAAKPQPKAAQASAAPPTQSN